MSITSAKNDNLGDSSFVNSQIPIPPQILGYSVSGMDDTALDPAGGQTVLINGSNFQPGATVNIAGTQVAVVTRLSSNQLSFTSPALVAGTYTLFVVNADGGTAVYVPGLIYSNLPTWNTPAGSLGSYYETKAISNTVSASGDAPLTYSLYSGSLPTGSTLSSSGVISGTAPVADNSTTYTFSIEAIDAQLQSSIRSFSLTINTDVVTWTNPANGATISLDGTAYTTTLTATDAAGYSTSFTANALPSGLTLSGNTISGTPTVQGNVTTLLTATAATTNRSATNTITWVVNLGDLYWSSVGLLLSATTPTTNVFVSDASLNNTIFTIVGDTQPSNRIPFASNPGTVGSAYFDGTGDYLTASIQPIGTGDFTLEFWMYQQSGESHIFTYAPVWGDTTGIQLIYYAATSNYALTVGNANNNNMGALIQNSWVHVAIVRSSGSVKFYLNGTASGATLSTTSNLTATALNIGYANTANWAAFRGYITNFRIVRGTAVYTANFTPPTSPLSAISGTSLLTLQTNQPANNSKFIDSSTTYSITTKNGNATQGTFTPFGESWSNYFTGTSDYLTTPSSAALSLGTGDFTVEMWVNSQDVTVQSQRGFFQISDTAGGLKTTYTTGITCYFAGAGTGSINTNVGGTDYGSATGLVQPNTWYHVAVTRASGTVRLWLNGTQVATGSNNTANLTGTYAAIGGYYSTSFLLPGYISNLRVVKGTALYSATFTPSTTPLPTVTGTSLLTCQSPGFVDNSINAIALTRNGSVITQDFSPFAGTTLPNPAYSVFFDGSSSYNVTTNQNSFDFGTGDFTIEFWTYLNANGNYGFFYDTRPAASSGNSLSMYHQSPGVLVLMYNITTFLQTGSNALPVGAWTHVAVTRASGTVRIFINGTQSASTTDTRTYGNSANRPIIGTDKDSSMFINGYLSNFRVVKGTALYTSNFTPSTTPLTAVSGTSLLVQSNTVVDSSSLNNTLNITANIRTASLNPFTPQYSTKQSYASSVIGGSMSFDGTGDFVSSTTGGSLGAGNFTVEAWVYAINWTTYGAIVENTNTGRYQLGFTGTNQIVFFSGSAIATTPTNTAVRGQWIHVAVVRNGSATNNISIYINGTRQAQGTSTTNFSDDGLRVGMSFDNYGITGQISNLRIIKGTALYTNNFVPQNRPLTAVTNTSLLLSGTSGAIIDSASQNNFETVADAKILSGATSPGTPYLGSYYSNYFNGTNAYLTVAANAAFAFGTGDFTVEAWVYLTAATSTRLVTARLTNGGASGTWSFNISGTTLSFTEVVAGEPGPSATVSSMVGSWNHVAASRVSGVTKLFLNGTSVASATQTTNFNNTSYNLSICTDPGSTYLTGNVSNLRIVKGTGLYSANFTPSTTPLTAVSGTSLLTCQSNRFIDNSTNAFSITPSGPPVVQSYNPFQNNTGGSIYLDGTGDYLSTPSSNINIRVWWGKSFTLEYWIYANALNQEIVNTTPVVIGNMDPAGATCYWAFGPMANGTVKWYYWNGSAQSINTSTVIATRQWYHLAFVNNNGSLAIYINGVSSATGTVSGTPQSSATLPISIGAVNNTYFNGYVSDLRITSGVARYTTNFTPPTTALPTR